MKHYLPILLFCLSILDPLFAQKFVKSNSDFIGLGRGSAIWGDLNNNGFLDVLITGTCETGPDIVMYKNIDGNELEYVRIEDIVSVHDGKAAFIDYNNNGLLDILLVGLSPSGKEICKLYENLGDFSFQDTNFEFTGLAKASLACGDYNNDGWMDFAIAGVTSNKRTVTLVYENQKGKGFKLKDFGFVGVADGCIAWIDYNNDGLLDFAITGSGNTNIYKNIGNGFEDINAQLPGLYHSTMAWGDYNNDGFPDLALTGTVDMRPSGLFGMIYLNADGNTLVEDFEFPGVWKGASLAWGDYDNDEFADLLVVGDKGVKTRDFYILGNECTQNKTSFQPIKVPIFPKINQCSVSWGDFNNNGMLDILYAGTSTGKRALANITLNNLRVKPYIPDAPTSVKNFQNGNHMILTWLPLPDTFAYSYNVRVGTEPGTDNILGANLSGEKIKQPVLGNVGYSSAYTLRDLTPNQTYYWSVQVVSNSFLGGAFSAESSFKIVDGLPEIQSLVMKQNENLIEIIALVSSLSKAKEVGFLYEFSMEGLLKNPKVLAAEKGKVAGTIVAKTPILRDYDRYFAIPYVKTDAGTSYGLPMSFLYPQPPEADASVMYCFGKPATPLEAKGKDLKWYSTSSLYTPLDGTPIPNTYSEGRQYFWVTQTIDEIESERKQIIVHVAKSEPNYLMKKTLTFDTKQSVFLLPTNRYVGSYEWELPEGWYGHSTTSSIRVLFTNNNPSGKIKVTAHNGCGKSDPVEIDITQTETTSTVTYTSRGDLPQ